MSYASTDKDFDSMGIDFHDLINEEGIITSLKTNLIINNIKGPIFDYYKHLKRIKFENEILNDISKNNKLASKSETISEIDKKEQKQKLIFFLFCSMDVIIKMNI